VFTHLPVKVKQDTGRHSKVKNSSGFPVPEIRMQCVFAPTQYIFYLNNPISLFTVPMYQGNAEMHPGFELPSQALRHHNFRDIVDHISI